MPSPWVGWCAARHRRRPRKCCQVPAGGVRDELGRRNPSGHREGLDGREPDVVHAHRVLADRVWRDAREAALHIRPGELVAPATKRERDCGPALAGHEGECTAPSPRGALLRGWGSLPLGRRRCRRGVQSLKTLLAQTMIILRVVLRHHHPGLYTNSEPLSQADGDHVPGQRP
jgi:hypothetical protein